MGEEGRKLSVLIDARKLKDGGIGQYTYTIIDEIVSEPSLCALLDLTILLAPSQVLPDSWQETVTVVRTRIRPYSLSEQFRLGRVLNKLNPDVVHIPHFTVPRGINVPTVATIHDLIQIRFPERWYYPLVASTLVRSALKRATRVVVVSEATRYDVMPLAPQSRALSVIPNAVDPFFSQVVSQPLGDQETSQSPTFLAVYSNPKPHKGMSRLFEAFALFCAQRPEGALHIVGQGVAHEAVRDRLALLSPQVRRRIHIHGAVPREELRRLYHRSHALVVSSSWEGFCLPVIEAHACGKPVITTPVPAVRELVLDGDIVARDFSQEGLSEALIHFADVGIRTTVTI